MRYPNYTWNHMSSVSIPPGRWVGPCSGPPITLVVSTWFHMWIQVVVLLVGMSTTTTEGPGAGVHPVQARRIHVTVWAVNMTVYDLS